MVAFPQRRGRGRSGGLYDEGFNADRAKGYTCETKRTLAGADRALADVDAVIAALQKRPDVRPGPVLLLGQSRGGALAVAYAGLRPKKVHGVVNFVGGWVGGCPIAAGINRTLMNGGAAFRGRSCGSMARRTRSIRWSIHAGISKPSAQPAARAGFSATGYPAATAIASSGFRACGRPRSTAISRR